MNLELREGGPRLSLRKGVPYCGKGSLDRSSIPTARRAVKTWKKCAGGDAEGSGGNENGNDGKGSKGKGKNDNGSKDCMNFNFQTSTLLLHRRKNKPYDGGDHVLNVRICALYYYETMGLPG